MVSLLSLRTMFCTEKLLVLQLNFFTQKCLQEQGILCLVTQREGSKSIRCLQIPLSSIQPVTFSLGSTVNSLLKSLLSLLHFHIKIKRFDRTLQVMTTVASKCPASFWSSKCCRQYNIKPTSPYIKFKNKRKKQNQPTNQPKKLKKTHN